MRRPRDLLCTAMPVCERRDGQIDHPQARGRAECGPNPTGNSTEKSAMTPARSRAAEVRSQARLIPMSRRSAVPPDALAVIPGATGPQSALDAHIHK
jgi:hypothetical protein